MAQLRVLALVVASSLALHWAARAEEIYKWVDKEGRVHFSNLPQAGAAPGPDDPKVEKTEEPSAKADDPMRGFAKRTQAAVNSVEFQLHRKNRDLRRARFDLAKTRDEVAEAELLDPVKLPVLRLRERRGTSEVERLEKEVAAMEAQVAKLRALKSFGDAEAD